LQLPHRVISEAAMQLEAIGVTVEDRASVLWGGDALC
jgi:hypothetical protein